MRADNWLVGQLPVGMTEDDFLSRFVGIFQAVADTMMHHVDNLGHLGDVAVTTDAMVRHIGTWFGVDWVDPSLPDHLQRRIVREYAGGLLWRGTRDGLRRLLELISDGPARVTDSGGVYPEGEAPAAPPHVRLEVDDAGWATEADLLRIVRAELPASVTFDLIVGGRLVHGSST